MLYRSTNILVVLVLLSMLSILSIISITRVVGTTSRSVPENVTVIPPLQIARAVILYYIINLNSTL